MAGGNGAADSGGVESLPVAILCGGRGTRLQEHTTAIPKALVEIGGQPIIWHVIRIYAAQGFRRFFLLTGYKGEMIADWVAEHQVGPGVEIEAVDTGLDTPTGGRIHSAAHLLEGGTFCATYADGVADIDLGELVRFHRDHGKTATMTVIRPFSQWGIADIDDDDIVAGFKEKPRLQYWINGGFFVFEPAFLEHVSADSVLEQEPLRAVAADGGLKGFRHDGFWECMDTYKDATQLNDLWNSGEAPWRVWEPEVMENAP